MNIQLTTVGLIALETFAEFRRTNTVEMAVTRHPVS